jgi:hypothetical protein
LAFVFSVTVCWGQETKTDSTAKSFYIGLNTNFKKEQPQLDTLKIAFKKIKESVSIHSLSEALFKSLDSIRQKIRANDKISDSLYNLAKESETYFVNAKNVNKNSIEKKWAPDIFKYVPDTMPETKDTIQKTTVYTYISKDFIFAPDSIFRQNTRAQRILKEELAQKSETYFGDITIPKENQKFNFYWNKRNTIEKKISRGKDNIGEPTKLKHKTKKYKEKHKKLVNNLEQSKDVQKQKLKDLKKSPVSYRFKKIDIEIKDGEFSDIKVYVEYNGSTHIFSNKKGVGLLRFSSVAQKNYLFYKQSIIGSTKFSLDTMRKFCIRLSDVMVYDYKIGNHYVPNNLTLELPKKDIHDSLTNKNGSAEYQIKQETDLNKIVELRTYSDFLALFGNSDNGLVQVEGKAKFYVFPFPMKIWGAQCEVLSSLSPHVSYSRFASSAGDVNLNSNKDSILSALDLVKKRYLTMGVEGNFFNFEQKDYPVEASLYGFANYQLSKVNLGNDSVPKLNDIKALSLGFGLELTAKRLNNFGFNYRFELAWYNYRDFNNIENLFTPKKLLFVIRNEAEVSYHPTSSVNSAVFIRLLTFNNSRHNNNEAFYQFQFGYKFSIGNRKMP